MRKVDAFNKMFPNGVLNCEVFERWEAIHLTSLTCGRKEKISISKTIGVSVEEYNRFESSIGATIGIKGFADFTSELKTEKGVTLTKEHTQTTSFETEFEADPCGRKSITLNQLVREYRFTYGRFQRFGQPSPKPVRNIVTEYLRCFNDQSERIPVIPDCACAKDPAGTYVDMEGRLGENYSINYQSPKTGSFHLWGRKIDYDLSDVNIDNPDRTFSFERGDIPPYIYFLLDGEVETTLRIDLIREYDPFLRPEVVLESVLIKPSSFDNDYEKRRGYDEGFLKGYRITTPNVTDSWSKQVYYDYSAKLIFDYHHFSVAMNRQRRMPLWTASNAFLHKGPQPNARFDEFSIHTDPRIAPNSQMSRTEITSMLKYFDLVQMVNYFETSRENEFKEQQIADTFHSTNLLLIPRRSEEFPNWSLFRTIWPFIPIHKQGYPAVVFTGPIFSNEDPSYFGTQLPQSFWRVVVAMDKAEQLVAYGLRTSIAFNHIEFEPANLFGGFSSTLAVPVRSISKMTGIMFDPQLYQADVLRDNPTMEFLYEPVGV